MKNKLKDNYYLGLISLLGLYMNKIIKSIENKTDRRMEKTINANIETHQMTIAYDLYTDGMDILFNMLLNIDGGEYIEIDFNDFKYDEEDDDLHYLYNELGNFIIEYIKSELGKIKNIKTKMSKYGDGPDLTYLIKLNDLELFLKNNYFDSSIIDLLLI